MHVFSAHNLCRLYVAAILVALRALRHDVMKLVHASNRDKTLRVLSRRISKVSQSLQLCLCCSMLRQLSWLCDHDESLRSSAQDSRSSRFYDLVFAAAGLIDDTRIWNPTDPMCVAHTSNDWNALANQSYAQDFGWFTPRDPPEESANIKTA